MSGIIVFQAKKIITMNPSQPVATAIAIRDGRILEVSTLERLKPWLDAHPHTIDDSTFREKVLMPGFIDPHLHPDIAGYLLPMHFVTPTDWDLPWGMFRGVSGQDAYLGRLKEIEASMPTPDEPLFSWGYHQLWHGKLNREILDAQISSARPIVVFHRSFHEIFFNTAALKHFKMTDASKYEENPQVNYAEGHFFELGMASALPSIQSYITAPERFKVALDRSTQVIHFGGHTTICDMTTGGLVPVETLIPTYRKLYEDGHVPFRIFLNPAANLEGPARGGNEKALAYIETLPKYNTRRIRYERRVKLFADGAMFSQVMQVGGGYIDGHHGEWAMSPEQFEAAARVYWNAGYQIHVHVTGDLGVDMILDTVEKLQNEKPRINHRFSLEHFGLSTPEQAHRIAQLGVVVSANPYYLYELSDMYSKFGLGYERASQMARLGSLVREGVPVALHSDFTMAPALPLTNAWVAANRIDSAGNVMSPEERLTLDQVLRAITIDAAYILNKENEIGSLRSGKLADMTVLEQDPYEVGVENLKDIKVWGTVFEGEIHPVKG